MVNTVNTVGWCMFFRNSTVLFCVLGIIGFLQVGCDDVVLPDVSKMKEEFTRLHRIVYDVYGLERSPQQLHQLLEGSFFGEALTKEYIEHYTTLVHMQEDETSIDIKQIDYNHIDILEITPTTVVLDVDWSVGGIVTHQKHQHTRVNRYHAVYTVKKISMEDTQTMSHSSLDHVGEWKIVQSKMRNAERVRRPSDEDLLNPTNAGGGYLDPLDVLDAMGTQNTNSASTPPNNPSTE